MMKHGLLMPALLCWAATAVFAVQGSPGVSRALDPTEMEAVEGGDLFLGVDRNRQMMTVTQVTPGQYYGAQSYSVKVTTAVVQNKEVTAQLSKGDMTNAGRQVSTSATTKTNEKLFQLPVQFPSGTYALFPQTTTLPNIQGPAIRTSASQTVPVVNAGGTLVGSVPDSGYFIHYANPAVTTNTLGCIGVQSLGSMAKLVDTLNKDTASYPKGTAPNQTVTVTGYTSGTQPSAAAFTPAGATPPSPAPTSTSTLSSSSSSSTSTKAPTATTPAPAPAPAPAPTPVATEPVVTAPPAQAPAVTAPVTVVPKAPKVTKTVPMKDL